MKNVDHFGWQAPTWKVSLNSRRVSTKGDFLCIFLGQNVDAAFQYLMKRQLREEEKECNMNGQINMASQCIGIFKLPSLMCFFNRRGYSLSWC